MIKPDYDGYLSVSDTQLYYRLYGKGHPHTLLFLHGNGEDWHCFENQIEPFSKDYQIILLDSRGHGKSGHGEGTLTLRRMAADIPVFLRKLNLKRVILIGFSDGANISLLAALHSSFPFEALILSGGNLFPKGIRFRDQFPFILNYYRYCFTPFLSKEKQREKEYLGLMVREPCIQPDSLKRITCPVLVLAGSRDMIKRSHTRLIARSLPNATLSILPGADHFLFGRFAEETNAKILSFLQELSLDPAKPLHAASI